MYHQLQTTGGTQTHTLYSGTAGGDQVLWSGAGLLANALIHLGYVSGRATIYYDSAIAVSGGPIAASGHKIVGVIPVAPQSGLGGATAAGMVTFGVPFFSGLCMTGGSGQVGITTTFTPFAQTGAPRT